MEPQTADVVSHESLRPLFSFVIPHLRSVGVWIVPPRSRFISRLQDVHYRAIQVVMCSVCALLVVYMLVAQDKGSMSIINHSRDSMVILVLITKLRLLKRDPDGLRSIVVRLKNVFVADPDEAVRASILRATKISGILCGVFKYGIFFLGFLMSAVPAASYHYRVMQDPDSAGKIPRSFPLHAWYPFDVESDPGYSVAYALESCTVAFLAFGYTSFDCLYISFVLQWAAHVGVLTRKVESIRDTAVEVVQRRWRLRSPGRFSIYFDLNGPESLIREEMKTILAHYARIHEELIQIAKVADRRFNFGIFSHLTLGAIGLALTFFEALKTQTVGGHLAFLVTFMFCQYLDVLLFCSVGEQFAAVGDALRLATYNCDWVSGDVPFRRHLLFVMLRCNKITNMTVGPTAILGLPLFVEFSKTVYSWMNLLNHVNS